MTYKIILTEDGCWRKDLTIPMPKRAINRTFRELYKLGHKYTQDSKWSLDLLDCESGRLCSHIQPSW